LSEREQDPGLQQKKNIDDNIKNVRNMVCLYNHSIASKAHAATSKNARKVGQLYY